MGTINWGRVLLGGLVAGVVMNVGEGALHGGDSGSGRRSAAEGLRPP